MARVVRVNGGGSIAGEMGEVVRCLRAGQLIAFPTETFYGLGVNPWDEGAVQRLFRVKGRPHHKPLLLVIHHPAQLVELTEEVPAAAQELIARFWPGPLTLVFKAIPTLPPLLTGYGGTIGIRQTAHPVTRLLLQAANLPLTATSANRSGGMSPTTSDQVTRGLGEEIDLILDAGPTPGGVPSTVLDVSGPVARLRRRGAVATVDLEACLGYTLEVVDVG